MHPYGNAVYISRPCQYVDAEKSGCPPSLWLEGRFSGEVVNATNQVIDWLKREAGASRLTLVGYSGGGTIAALVSSWRSDVATLITIAGNLNVVAWVGITGLHLLRGALNPVAEVDQLRRVPQWLLVGSRDPNIHPELLKGYAQRFPDEQRPKITVMPEFDHSCWAENWTRLWETMQR